MLRLKMFNKLLNTNLFLIRFTGAEEGILLNIFYSQQIFIEKSIIILSAYLQIIPFTACCKYAWCLMPRLTGVYELSWPYKLTKLADADNAMCKYVAVNISLIIFELRIEGIYHIRYRSLFIEIFPICNIQIIFEMVFLSFIKVFIKVLRPKD